MIHGGRDRDVNMAMLMFVMPLVFAGRVMIVLMQPDQRDNQQLRHDHHGGNRRMNTFALRVSAVLREHGVRFRYQVSTHLTRIPWALKGPAPRLASA